MQELQLGLGAEPEEAEGGAEVGKASIHLVSRRQAAPIAQTAENLSFALGLAGRDHLP